MTFGLHKVGVADKWLHTRGWISRRMNLRRGAAGGESRERELRNKGCWKQQSRSSRSIKAVHVEYERTTPVLSPLYSRVRTLAEAPFPPQASLNQSFLLHPPLRPHRNANHNHHLPCPLPQRTIMTPTLTPTLVFSIQTLTP